MFIANDSNGNRIDAYDASKNNKYFCPVCGEEVQFKKGDVNVPHFAHFKATCLDNWNYDMSWWHREVQNCFPPECREIIVNNKTYTHRADILIDDIVIEIQHSPISLSEFNERNRFFTELGFRIAWIFDLTDQYDNESIYCQEYIDGDYLMRWKHPKRIFASIPRLSDYNNKFALWFAYSSKKTNDILLDKVIWAPLNEYGERVLNRFIVSQYINIMRNGIDPNELFYTKEDSFRRILHLFRQKNKAYSIKYKGEKGHNKIEYTCERKQRFGIKLFSETGCAYCKYCHMIVVKKRGDESKWAVYCGYPNQVRELCDDLSEHECEKVNIYSI